ncbi:MAG: ATP-binding cassette domain-containing protein [Rhodobacter sp.]|jgi:putative ABC transport system ATP-binding protein|nr:ATP-binding cassette domain-containing protein [Rhodobacter sp.]
MQTEFPISINGLNHWFGTAEARKQAIYEVTLNIRPGTLTVMVGPSGSGKTTLLTLMGCLRDVQEGSVALLGHELHGVKEDMATRLRRRLGFIFQAHNLHGSLTALQNVRMGLQVHGTTDAATEARAAAHILTLLGLADRLDYLPANLSGGQKQRVAIARALAASPAVVFADEPTAALDRDSAANVVSLLKRLGEVRGTTTVMVTHDSRILERADRILTLEDGRLVADTAPA